MPTNQDDKVLMTKMWAKAVIPEAKVRVARIIAEILKGGSLEELLTPPEMLTPPEQEVYTEEMIELIRQISRFIFTMDGCWAQLKATFEDINQLFNKEGFEGFKFAAASTMVQQPNDVGRMHSNIHAFYKSDAYARDDYHVPNYMKPMEQILRDSGLQSSSFHTYWKALARLPECLLRSCQPTHVRDGFVRAGIWPVDHPQIMSGWTPWSALPTAKAKVILSKLPELIDLARKGRLLDDEIEAPFEGLLAFDPLTRKSDDCAWNHTRCLWTNNEAVVAAYITTCEEKAAEEVRLNNIRLLREEKAEEARAQLRDNPNLPPNVAGKEPPRYKCSNPVCVLTGTAKERRLWSGCKRHRQSKCTLFFCTSDVCAVVSANHQVNCTK